MIPKSLLIAICIFVCSNIVHAQAGEFPNTIGNFYKYAVTDSDGKDVKHYEVKVSVVGESLMPNKMRAKIWIIKSPDSIDTNYVLVNKDTILVYDKTKNFIKDIFYFPLSKGQKWSKLYKNGRVLISDIVPLTSKTGIIQKAYLIQETGSAPNYSYYQERYFIPKIGISKIYLREKYFLSPTSQTWELIDYKTIKPLL